MFLSKVAPVQSITDIVLFDFFINTALLNVFFILHYHLFFRKEIYFSECFYLSEYDIRMSLYGFWLRKGLSIKNVRNTNGEMGKCHPKCVELMRTAYKQLTQSKLTQK